MSEQEMPAYRSLKIVRALKIANIEYDRSDRSGPVWITPADPGCRPFVVERDYLIKHYPEPGGYYVLYEDGYQIFLPAEVFESRYAPHDKESLSFSALRAANIRRAYWWHPKGLEEWSVNDWLTAFGGEAGEALNAGKKHRRILSGIQQHGNVPTTEREAAMKIMEELADTVIYADLVAARLGMSLEEAVVSKFNAISEREGFSERL